MRQHRNKWKIVAFTAGAAMLVLAGCGSTKEASATQQATQKGRTVQENPAQSGGEPSGTTEGKADGISTLVQAGSGEVTVTLAGGIERSIIYKEEDLQAEWDQESAVRILLEDGGSQVEGAGAEASGNLVTIKKAGTYVVSGTLSDGQIFIDAGQDTVRLVLDGVTLASQTTAPLYREDKGKTILTLADGSKNVIQDGTSYEYPEEGQDEPDAPLFFKGDLTINGSGELEVAGNYQCGIRSKENLLVVSGTIGIQSVDDGLKGRESVVIRDGVLDIRAGKDGIKSNQDKDEQAGYIWINGGTVTIAAEDDGIQAETALIVNGGDITITRSQEALAGKTVDILGGVIHGQAEDDGINSAASVETEQEKMQNQEGVYTRIAGGEIHINARADGIDSNGDLYIEGGALYLTGPSDGGNGILDYNGDASLTGGVVFAAGSSGMMQTFGKASTQNYLVVYYGESQEAGTQVQLTDQDGNVLGSYSPEKRFEAIIISVPGLAEGSTCHVITGDNTVELTVEGIETVSGTPASGAHGMGGRRGMGRPEGMEPPEGGERPARGERPEGMEPPEGGERPARGKMPEGGERPARGEMPEGMEPPEDEERPE